MDHIQPLLDAVLSADAGTGTDTWTATCRAGLPARTPALFSCFDSYVQIKPLGVRADALLYTVLAAVCSNSSTPRLYAMHLAQMTIVIIVFLCVDRDKGKRQ